MVLIRNEFVSTWSIMTSMELIPQYNYKVFLIYMVSIKIKNLQ